MGREAATVGALLLAAAMLSACGSELERPANANIRTRRAATWSVSGVETEREWSSGKTTSLSPWQTRDCYSDLGSLYMPAEVKGWRERSGNADNFTARMTVRCSEYKQSYGYLRRTTTVDWATLYSGAYRSTSGSTSLSGSADLPIGFRFNRNSGNGYVKDFELVYGTMIMVPGPLAYVTGYADQSGSGWALNFGSASTEHTLICPDQHVMSKLAVRYDTRNGKVRRFKIGCRALRDL
ncbi:MAG: hypothetical protein KC503_38850 [Myxococcales bacterium]|nr:hypothetical protein [Myxococcales bacterium]